ncbi:MAG: SH3 domain-containing protein [Planctomycetes bacterium]|nr:SH3 domain-containing protein [Planctomycetota bacterium]
MRRPWQLAFIASLLSATAALAAEPGTKEGTPAKSRFAVIIQDRVPVQFEQTQIGELNEGVRVEIRESRDDWCRVRALFGKSWFEGWVRLAMTTPDSLVDTPVKALHERPTDVYRDPFDTRREYIIPGMQFLEVRVKFEPDEKSPTRVYFDWSDEKTADLCLRYGRDSRAIPYGFIKRVPGLTRATFERDEKRHTLILTPGEAAIETYVFAVPVRARDFDLALRDITLRVPPAPPKR